MSNQEILEKAIIKAAEAGWELPGFKMLPHDDYVVEEDTTYLPGWFEKTGNFILRIDGSVNPMHINQVLFDKGFAMALWGRRCIACEDRVSHGHGPLLNERWQYHLQQMVISPDPITYLGAHL